MLKKVLKYDIKYNYKALIIFYGLTIFFSILTRIFWSFDNSTILNILGYIASGTTISFIFNILINNMMRLWVRFISNIYKDESYLTHTLPISKKTIYSSKFLSAIISSFTSILIIILTMFIAYYSKENLEILKLSLTSIATIYNSTVIKLILTFFFIFFLEMLFIITVGYTGIIIGHKSNNNKIVKSIIYGFIIYLISQTIILLLIFIISLFNQDMLNLFITNELSNFKILKTVIYLSIIIYSIYIFIF